MLVSGGSSLGDLGWERGNLEEELLFGDKNIRRENKDIEGIRKFQLSHCFVPGVARAVVTSGRHCCVAVVGYCGT